MLRNDFVAENVHGETPMAVRCRDGDALQRSVPDAIGLAGVWRRD